MGYITPLLDTLLHEVLGRRMDSLTRREIPEPVKPVSPSDAPQALRSDSRLDARRPQPTGGSNQAQARSTGSTSLPPPAYSSSPSSYTRLSPAAHVISAVLARYPAPASVLRGTEPLLSPGQMASHGSLELAGRPLAEQLTEKLHSGVRDSGLFYESHLKGWFRAERPRAQLMREPQMQAREARSSLASALGASAAKSAAGLDQAGGARETAQPGRGADQFKGEEFRPVQEPAAKSGASSLVDGVDDRLQSVLRHQLELLASPVLRWEGELLPGLFLTFALHAPSEQGRKGADEEAQGGEAEGDWQMDLTLRLPELGALSADLRLRGNHLRLTLQAFSPELYGLVQAEREALVERLAAAGLEPDVRIEAGKEADD